MNTNLNNSTTGSNFNLQEALLTFNDLEEQIEFEATLIHLNFIDQIIEQFNSHESVKSKKDLADKLSTSKSYITQLFAGDKLLNLRTLAKLQRIFNVKIEINIKTLKNTKMNIKTCLPKDKNNNKNRFVNELLKDFSNKRKFNPAA